MTIDLAKMMHQIAVAGLPHDPQRCKSCDYREDVRGQGGYCYMFWEEPTSWCFAYKEEK